MDLNALTLLVEIIDAGNLSKAAQRLNMSRANVSHRLNQFERSMGQQLLRRTTRLIEPTELGMRLYQHGRVIRNELMAAKESVSSLGQSLHGRVRLSVPSGYGQLVMTDWLLEFMHLYPDIALEVIFDNQIDDLMEGSVDVAVRVMVEPPDNLVARDMGAVQYVACASKAYAQSHRMPQELADLRRVPLLTSTLVGRQLNLSGVRQGDRQGDRQDVRLEPRLVSPNFYFLRQAIAAGLGVGVLPSYMVAQALQSGELVTALDGWQLQIFGTHMYTLYMPNCYQTLAISTLIEFILDKAQNDEQRLLGAAPSVASGPELLR